MLIFFVYRPDTLVVQGLKAYLEQERRDLKSAGVVLSYDGRHNSRRWARLAAGVFIRSEVPVFLFETTTPTPFVPYTVVKVSNIFYSNIIILTSLIENIKALWRKL
jgi:phosphomannomutase